MSDYDDRPHVIVEHHTASVSAFLRGALLGAGVALLFAPRAGREVRRRMREELLGLRDQLEGRVEDTRGVVRERVDDFRGEMQSRVEGARHEIDSRRSDLEYRVRESREAIKAGFDAARRGRPAAQPEQDLPGVAADPEAQEQGPTA